MPWNSYTTPYPDVSKAIWSDSHDDHHGSMQHIMISLMQVSDFWPTRAYLFGLTSLSTIFVISWRVSGCNRKLMCCLTEISRPRHMPWYSTKLHYTVTGLTISSSNFSMLNVKRKEQAYLVWLGPRIELTNSWSQSGCSTNGVPVSVIPVRSEQ